MTKTTLLASSALAILIAGGAVGTATASSEFIQANQFHNGPNGLAIAGSGESATADGGDSNGQNDGDSTDAEDAVAAIAGTAESGSQSGAVNEDGSISS